MVTMRADSKGVIERLVSVASAGLKVLGFELDPRIALFPGNSNDLRHLKLA